MNNKFNTGGLEHTPKWRWFAYVGIFLLILTMLGNKSGEPLWIAGLIVIPIVASLVIGMCKVIHSDKGKVWMGRHMPTVIVVYVVLQTALMIWDVMAKK